MGEVHLELAAGVATITIAAPEIRNGLDARMGAALEEICATINADRSLGAAVIRGAGGTFCSGADTRAWGPGFDPASPDGVERVDAIYRAFVSVGDLLVPTVAAVRGAAVGAGLNLAMAADLRIVADNARLMAGFLKIGIHPGGGFFSLLNRLGSRDTTVAMGLFSEEISGSDAARLGLAWRSVPDEIVESTAMDLAKSAAKDPELTRAALKSFRTETGPPQVGWPAALEMERGVQMWSQKRKAL